MVKGSFALHPNSAARDLEESWILALSPPLGAVHLALSPDIAPLHVSGNPLLVAEPIPTKPRDTDLAHARKLLRRSASKMILAGLGVEVAGVQVELLRLAGTWQVPVAVTPKAKGHFPESLLAATPLMVMAL